MSRLSSFSPRQRYLVSALVAAAAIASQPGCDREKPPANAAPPSGTGAPGTAAPTATSRSLTIGNAATIALIAPEPLQFSAATLDAADKPSLVAFGTFDPAAGVLASTAKLSPGARLRIRLAPHTLKPGESPRISIDGPVEKLAELPMSGGAAEYILTVSATPVALQLTSTKGRFAISPAKP